MELSYIIQKSYFNRLTTATTETGTKNPNDININVGHNIATGLDFHISPDHTITWKANYLNSANNHLASYNWYDELSSGILYNETQQNKSDDNDFNTSLIYRGTINDNWSLYSAIGYNYIKQNTFNKYEQFNRYLSESKYDNLKNYIRGEVDVTYNVNDQLSFNAGYIGTWNEYN